MKDLLKRIAAWTLAICLLCGCVPALAEEEIELPEIEEEVSLDDEELTDEEKEDFETFFISSDEAAALDLLAEDMTRDESVDPNSLDANLNLPENVINVLLIGIDTREAKDTADSVDNARGDVQMILSVNTDTGALKITSILRDTYVTIPGYKNKNRINVAYQRGGGELSMRTINYNFGLNIQYYVSVNFYGLASIIDAIGGIDVDLTKVEAGAINTYLKKHPPKYDNTNGKSRVKLKRQAGVQHLDGVQAVMYARLREIDNDFARTARQRHLMELLLQKVMQDMDVAKLLTLMDTALPYVYTNVDVQTIFTLASKVLQSGIVGRAQNGDKLMEEHRIPMDGTYGYKTVNGSSVVSMNTNNFQKNVDALYEFIYGTAQ